jgi:hypothetical protein
VPASGDIWIGGCLALAGTALGIFSSLAAGHFDRKNRRDRLVRKRFEELAQLLDVAKTYLLRLNQCHTFDEVAKEHPPAEVRRIVVLSLIYFPEFKVKAIEYHNFIMETYRLAVSLSPAEKKEGWPIGARLAKHWQDIDQPRDKLQKVSEALDDLIERYAEKYTLA